jgi:hypothetical protein
MKEINYESEIGDLTTRNDKQKNDIKNVSEYMKT